jgi:outer membrane protein assembly factor BamB
MRSRLLLASFFVAALTVAAPAADWPQWRGPNRDGLSLEKGLLTEWPSGGPKLVWNSKLVNGGKSVGTGFSSMAIVKGRIFTMGDLKGEGCVFCLDEQTGKLIWQVKVGPAGGDGPRGTPTIDGDRVYTITRQGILSCQKAASGDIVWQKDFKKDFGGHMMSGWDYSESPTIDGDKLICTPGGDKAAVMAFDKMTGSVLWASEIANTGGAGYATVAIADVGGKRQYITLLGAAKGLVGVDAETGKLLWNYKKIGNGTANIPTAIVKGDLVFTSTGYNTGAALLRLQPTKNGCDAREVYFHKGNTLQNHHGGMVLLGDYIYGGHGHNEGRPFCLDMKTGKFAWGPETAPGGGSAAVTYADGHLYFRYEDGPIALIEATPKGYNLKSQFTPKIAGNGWPHPVVLNGHLYIRGQDQVHCYDLRK